uniref:Uncharacterized protein n=1 Tax=Triticum urartu TaxID=4572 RepID=A0A8R7PTE8_TRIUA
MPEAVETAASEALASARCAAASAWSPASTAPAQLMRRWTKRMPATSSSARRMASSAATASRDGNGGASSGIEEACMSAAA